MGLLWDQEGHLRIKGERKARRIPTMPIHTMTIQAWNKRYLLLTCRRRLRSEIYEQERCRSSHHNTTEEIPNQNELERRLLSWNDTRLELPSHSQRTKRATINARLRKGSTHRIQTPLHQTTILCITVQRPHLWKKSTIRRYYWNTNIHKETNSSTTKNMRQVPILRKSNW